MAAPGAMLEEVASIDDTLCLLLVMQNEVLEWELYGLCFQSWGNSRSAKLLVAEEMGTC